MKKHYLMTPGPTQVPEASLLAQARPIVHHRSPAYTELLLETLDGLKYVFQTKRDIMLFASSGTGAMESAVANLFSPGDRVLVASTGNFGERWIKICKAYQLDVIAIEYEWGQRLNPADIESWLKKDSSIKGVFITHAETSTGVVNEVKKVAEITSRSSAVLIVDAVSGLGACELRMDEWGIDVVVSGSQKALMTPPGLAFAAVSERAWELVESSTSPRFYFDYRAYKKALEKPSPQNPYTPAICTIMALGESLRMIREEGIENVWERHRILAKATREGIKALGLKLFSPDDELCNAVTAVNVPEGIDGATIVKAVREEHGVWLAGGQGILKGKIFRIGHCGFYLPSDIILTLASLERSLLKLGFQLEPGSSLVAAQKVFIEEGL